MAIRGLPATAALLLALCLLVSGGVEADADEPLIPRSEMLTVSEVHPGMTGVGKSVFRGTRVESFGITVLGVLRRVDFDGDIILIRIDSGPPVSEGFGVVSGMSGSPIYVNGKLIGALAYAWQFAEQPIAGVTPIEQMIEAFRPGSGPVRREGTLEATRPFVLDGRPIERAVVAASPAAAPVALGGSTGLLVPIATPLLVSGLHADALPVLRRTLEPLGLVPLAGAGSMARVQTSMVPGQAVGARLVGGDLDLIAIGTITYVKDDAVLAFGHSLSGLAATDVPLVAAYVHGVMPSAMLSFKLASGGQVLGRFTQDRPWCLGGELGVQPDLVDSSLRVADADRGVSRGYRVQVVRSRSLTSMLLTTVLAGAIGSIGPPPEGTTRVRFALDAEGLPRFERTNTYTSENGLGVLALLLGGIGGAGSASGELSQILGVLQSSDFGEAKLERLDVSVEVSARRSLASIEKVTVPYKVVRPGEEVEVFITLRTPEGALSTRTERITIPPACPPGSVRIGICGGRSAEQLRARLDIAEPTAVSMAQMIEQMLSRPANDDLLVELALPTVGIEVRGFAFRDMPPAALDVLRSCAGSRLRPLRDHVTRCTALDWVVTGASVVTLEVEGDQKDKAGRRPSPEYRPPRYQQTGPGLADIVFGMGIARGRTHWLASGGAGEEIDIEAPPEMPSWEEVASVAEGELPEPSVGAGERPGRAGRGEAIGRVASIWRLREYEGLERGEAEGVALLSKGGLALAADPVELARIEARSLWPIAVGLDGGVYIGSWGDGAVRRISPGGQSEVVLQTDLAAVQALAAGPDAAVYAAAVPGGAIYRLPPDGQPVELCRLEVQNVWALAVRESGDLLAATGPGGGLYRVPAEGDPQLVFTARDRHVVALALAPDGTAYVATSPLGKVYAISPDGAARSVFEVEKETVQSIAVDASGAVYVGTSPKGHVIRIAGSGAAEEVLDAKGKHLLALMPVPGGGAYAAVGPPARLYRIESDGTSALLYEPRTDFIPALAVDSAGDLYVTAADTGRVTKLGLSGPRTGHYVSAPHDAGAVARWGAVLRRGPAGADGAITIWTRSGATAWPDDTWSDWQRVPGRPGARVQSPDNRFLQCRIDIQAEGPESPRLDALEVLYLPANRPPEVKLTSPKGDEIWSGMQTLRWAGRDADGDKLTYEVYWSSDAGETWTKIETAPEEVEEEAEGEEEEEEPEEAGETEPESPSASPPAAPEPSSGGRAPAAGETSVGAPVAGDIPEDELEDVIRMAGEMGVEEEMGEEEPPGEEELGREPSAGPPSRATSAKWDTTEAPDGLIWIRVVGSDARANPIDPGRDEVVSPAIRLDNTPPEIILDRRRGDADAPPGAVSAFDGGSYLTSAEFRVDEGEWLAAVPADGIFDGQYEAIILDRARLPEGAHTVEVRARDAAGNTSAATLRYSR